MAAFFTLPPQFSAGWGPFVEVPVSRKAAQHPAEPYLFFREVPSVYLYWKVWTPKLSQRVISRFCVICQKMIAHQPLMTERHICCSLLRILKWSHNHFTSCWNFSEKNKRANHLLVGLNHKPLGEQQNALTVCLFYNWHETTISSVYA